MAAREKAEAQAKSGGKSLAGSSTASVKRRTPSLAPKRQPFSAKLCSNVAPVAQALSQTRTDCPKTRDLRRRAQSASPDESEQPTHPRRHPIAVSPDREELSCPAPHSSPESPASSATTSRSNSSSNNWRVHGLARRSSHDTAGVNFISADLLDPASLRSAVCHAQALPHLHHHLAPPTHRSRKYPRQQRHGAQPTRSRLARLSSVQHVALVTGLKHYLGPFEAYGKGELPATPFREEQPRLNIENFYYAQEDEVFAAADRHHSDGASIAPTPSSVTRSVTP